MTTTHASPLARPLSHILRPALAMLAAFLVGGARGDWLWWDNGGSDTTFTTPENWSTDIFPGTGNVAAFEGDSTGKTIVFAAEGTQVGDVFVRNNWWSRETLSPVVFSASDSANGFASLGVFSCADMGGATYGCRSALTIQSGTYTAANTSYWGWGANAGLSMVIDGESRVVLNSGLNMMYGGFEDTANNIPWSNIGNVTNKIDIKSGALVVNGGNVLIGTNSDWSKTTINVGDADGNGATTGEFSVGSATTHSLKLSEYGCAGTTVEININKGGNLKAYNIIDGGGTGDPELSVVFNGGTLVALGVGDTSLVGEGITVVAGSNGGIIDAGANNVTIAAPVTGAGTITKKGTGTLTFTGDLSGFVGRVAVASGAGSVTLPATASRARAGDYTSVVENQDGTFTFAYDSTGSAAATATAEILNLDFEDANTYSLGWTGKTIASACIGSSLNNSAGATLSQGTRGNGSKYLNVQVAKVNGFRGAVRDIPTSGILDNEYIFEFDWFSAAGFQNSNWEGNSSGFALYDSNGNEIMGVDVPGGNGGTATIYKGAREESLGSIRSGRGSDPTSNQELWHHVRVACGANGSFLTITDGNGNVKINNAALGNFDNIAKMYVCLGDKSNNWTVNGGVDNVVLSTLAAVSVGGVNYATFAEAVAAATSTSTITLCRDVELATSVELPYGATLNLNGNILYTTDPDVAVTLDDGAHYLDSVIEGGVKTFKETALVYDNVSLWTGEGTQNADGSYNWSDSQNWTSLPTETKDVVFPANAVHGGWKVFLDGDKTVANVTFAGNTTLSGAILFASSYDGSGTVTLGDDAGIGNNNVEITISNPIEIAGIGAHTNKFYANGKNLTISGQLSGCGNLNLIASYDSLGVSLTGSNLMTSGSIVVEPTLTAYGQARRNCSRISPSASNSNLVWRISNGANNKHTGNYSFLNGTGTYYFGSLSNINQPAGLKNSVVEVGALLAEGETNSVGGVFYSQDSSVLSRNWNSSYTSATLRKVGKGIVSTSIISMYNYDIVDGTLVLALDNARPAAEGKITFSGHGTLALNDAFTVDVSTNIAAVTENTVYPIAIDVGTVSRVWERAIPTYYQGGLIKKGAGALTLEAVPTYTGTTKVEAGALYVVEGDWTPALDPATAEVASDMEGYRKFIPRKPSGVIFLIF